MHNTIDKKLSEIEARFSHVPTLLEKSSSMTINPKSLSYEDANNSGRGERRAFKHSGWKGYA